MAIAGFAKTDEVDALITKKLENVASKEDIKAAIDAANADNSSKLSEIQKTLAALTTPKTPDTTATTTTDDDPAVRVLTDPTKFVNDATKPLRDSNERVQAQVQEMRARQDPQLAGAFAKYGKELAEEAKKFPLSSHGLDSFWPLIIKNFLGDKMIKGEIRDGNFPSLMGASSVGVRSDGSSADPNFGFNSEVADFYRQRNIPLEKASKIQKLMAVDGEPITHANYFGTKAS